MLPLVHRSPFRRVFLVFVLVLSGAVRRLCRSSHPNAHSYAHARAARHHFRPRAWDKRRSKRRHSPA